MEVFPGSYIAKLSIGAASALGGVVVAVMSHRTGSAAWSNEGATTYILPSTMWLGILSALFEAILVADNTLTEERQESREGLPDGETVDRVWSGLVWAIWLVDVTFVTRLAIFGGADWSSPTSAKLGATCALAWTQWLLLTSRILVMVAETARVRLEHMMDALKGKLGPWWKMAKEPFVQILASFGVLLSGVVGSVAMLVTGVFGVFDQGLGVIGLGGLRRKIFNRLGFNKVTDRIDKTLSGIGLGGIIGDGDQKQTSGLEPIKQELGVGTGDAQGQSTGVAGTLSSLNPLDSGDDGATKRKSSGKKQS